jgi:hypothetical protein
MLLSDVPVHIVFPCHALGAPRLGAHITCIALTACCSDSRAMALGGHVTFVVLPVWRGGLTDLAPKRFGMIVLGPDMGAVRC